MREIKFRGKDIHFNKWVYGYYHYLENSKEHCILEYGRHTSTVIDEQSIGQFIGLYDKNGKEIYEGDIFGDASRKEIDVVVFEDGCFKLETYAYAECCLDGNAYEDRWSNWDTEPICNFNLENDEVIGNIYDNRELLEVKNDSE